MRLAMLWSPLYLSSLTLLFPSLTVSSELSAPITELAAFSSLAPCVAPLVEGGQATIYVNNCPQTDLAIAASCLCSKSANLASYTDQISSSVSQRCSAGASEEYSSALAVVTEFCSVAAGGMFVTRTSSGSEKSGPTYGRTSVNSVVASTTNDAVTVTVYTGQPTAMPNTARVPTRGDGISVVFVFVEVLGSFILAIAIL
ncbi:hypothetical protein DM02DRAFT_734267 [Periconia macrospinosa]|uniref:Extracellular membrane protein CFEM domain-containing protein n=1 Tax=Periconia macrospinosa TaxID=97972 RepID=A0A2V1CZI2_9PLEO|nr:hypothetical protein DM02DRAFT_734267 [Periconia macrospinosa]